MKMHKLNLLIKTGKKKKLRVQFLSKRNKNLNKTYNLKTKFFKQIVLY